jgi:hypothetical protein
VAAFSNVFVSSFPVRKGYASQGFDRKDPWRCLPGSL